MLCVDLSCVPTRQGGGTTTRRTLGATTDSGSSMGERDRGLHNLFAKVRRVWDNYGRGGQIL